MFEFLRKPTIVTIKCIECKNVGVVTMEHFNTTFNRVIPKPSQRIQWYLCDTCAVMNHNRSLSRTIVKCSDCGLVIDVGLNIESLPAKTIAFALKNVTELVNLQHTCERCIGRRNGLLGARDVAELGLN